MCAFLPSKKPLNNFKYSFSVFNYYRVINTRNTIMCIARCTWSSRIRFLNFLLDDVWLMYAIVQWISSRFSSVISMQIRDNKFWFIFSFAEEKLIDGIFRFCYCWKFIDFLQGKKLKMFQWITICEYRTERIKESSSYLDNKIHKVEWNFNWEAKICDGIQEGNKREST